MAKARRPGKRQKEESSRPSIFFIIAILVGFAIVVWWFFHFLPDRHTGEEPEKSARTLVHSFAGQAVGASYLLSDPSAPVPLSEMTPVG